MKKNLAVSILMIAAISLFGLFPEAANAGKGIFGDGSSADLERAKEMSLDILRGKMAERGIAEAESFSATKVEMDDIEMVHTRFQQRVNGIPVWGGEAIVHLNKDGSLFTITDDMLDSLAVNTEVNLSAGEAVLAAKDIYRGSKYLTSAPSADLWIYRSEKRDHVVYRIQMERFDGSHQTGMPVIFIDAQTGEKVFEYDNFQTQAATGTGSSLYSGSVSISTFRSGANYYMEDHTRRHQTLNYNNGTTSLFRFTDTDNIWNTAVQRAAVDAHWGARRTLDYFAGTHGRNGINGAGGPFTTTSINGTTTMVTSGVHYSSNYNNAGWTGSSMIYGDGNGVTFSPLVSLDVAGHELTHGVTQYSANRIYSNQSGALNEAVSDIFGAMIERTSKGLTANTWRIGEEIYTPGTAGDALRFMDNPHAASNKGFTADDDPDHYSERYTGASDNGGVHINSGIANKAFYLLSQGGTHHLGGSMTGIGAAAAERIWYRALTSFMTSSTNFAGARTATINASNALYGVGSVNSTRVAQAWTLCGV